jgi:uncharacterized protein
VLKKSVITGAISNAERIGRAYRKALDENTDCAEAVRAAGNGRQMFRGVIAENSYETRDGYTYGNMKIKGTDEYAGHELKIWYQNENIISWLDGEYYVTVPDLIVVMNQDARFPQLNPYAEAGTNVSVICLPADKPWRTEKGLATFGPKSFGHNVEWEPFCK